MQLDEQGRYDAIAVTGSLPLYDERFQRALKIGGRLFVVVGQSPVMEAWKITRLGEREWQREGAISTRAKLAALASMGVGYALSFHVAQPDTISAIALAVLLLAVAVFILTRPAPSAPRHGIQGIPQ